MEYYIILLVIFSSLMHSTWHSLVKISDNKLVSYSIINVFAAGVAALYLIYNPYIVDKSYLYLFFSVLLHLAYKVFLIKAYEATNFSLVFPISRGSAPVFIVIITTFFFLEEISYIKISLILLIGCLISFLSFPSLKRGEAGKKEILLAFCTGFITALYSLVDGYGGRISENPIAFICWMYIFDATIFPLYTIVKYEKETKILFVKYWRQAFFAALFSVISYGIIVFSMTKINISEVAAIREINIVFGTAIAYLFLKEKVNPYKWVVIVLITICVSLLSYLRY